MTFARVAVLTVLASTIYSAVNGQAGIGRSVRPFASFEEAAVAARSDRYEEAIEFARSAIGANSGDWRAWYVRFLAERSLPLDDGEEHGLLKIESPEVRAGLRLLREYIQGRESIPIVDYEDAAETYPSSGLVRAVLAARRMAAGDAVGAVLDARRAIELDPESFFAARTWLFAVARDPSSGDLSEVCELLPRFARDGLFTKSALEVCTGPVALKERLNWLEPVLLEQSDPGLRDRALWKLIQKRVFEPASDVDVRRLLALLEPANSAWWHAGSWVLYLIEQLPTLQGTRSTTDFLSRWVTAAAESPDTDREDTLEIGSRVLARGLEAQSRWQEALDVADRGLASVPMLRREALLRLRANALQGMNRSAEAKRAAEDAEFLRSGDVATLLHESSDSGRSSVEHAMRLFPRLTTSKFLNGDGKPVTVTWNDEQPRILFFSRPGCKLTPIAVRLLREATEQPGGALSGFGIEIIHVRIADRGGAAQNEPAIDDSLPVWSDRSEDSESPSRMLGVTASPTVDLVIPGGWVARESRGVGATTAWVSELATALSLNGVTKKAAQR